MALDGIVMSVRTPGGRRFVSSYTGVRRGSAGGLELEEYVRFDAALEEWELVREPPFIEEALRAGAIGRREVDRWRSCCPESREHSPLPACSA